MSIRIVRYLTPVLQPLYRMYVSRTRTYRYRSLKVRVSPGVFYPGFVFSTKFFLQYLEEQDLTGKKVLEVGSGSGILSLMAAKRGGIVTAADINPAAVKDTKYNANLNGLTLNVVESDLFEKVSGVFDYIIIAPPYYPKAPADHAEMAWYCGEDHEYFRRLFNQMPRVCIPSTIILMILSEDCDLKTIKELSALNGFRMEEICSRKNGGERTLIYRVIA